MKKILCYLFGHRYLVMATKENEQSVFGWIKCSRCNHEESFQYDFV